MKKYLCILLAIIVLFSICACAKNAESFEDTSSVVHVRADSKSKDSFQSLFRYASNTKTFGISSVHHIPTMPFGEYEKFTSFIEYLGDYYQTDKAYNNNKNSLKDQAERYDEAYFENNALIVLAATSSSPFATYKIKNINIADNYFVAEISESISSSTYESADWFISLKYQRQI